jgi:hypothetical protein
VYVCGCEAALKPTARVSLQIRPSNQSLTKESTLENKMSLVSSADMACVQAEKLSGHGKIRPTTPRAIWSAIALPFFPPPEDINPIQPP